MSHLCQLVLFYLLEVLLLNFRQVSTVLSRSIVLCQLALARSLPPPTEAELELQREPEPAGPSPDAGGDVNCTPPDVALINTPSDAAMIRTSTGVAAVLTTQIGRAHV